MKMDDTNADSLSTPTNTNAFIITKKTRHKLAKLVKHHPQFHSRLEELLDNDYNELEPVNTLIIGKMSVLLLAKREITRHFELVESSREKKIGKWSFAEM